MSVALKDRLAASVQLEEAASYLRAAKTPQELVSLWWRYCGHTEGEVRARLHEVYDAALTKLAPMGRAG